MLRPLYWILCFLFTCLGAAGQQGRQYSFRQFTTSNGLSSNTVHGIGQDSEGYIWIGTVNGLQRYDGNSFISFRSIASNPATIPSNSIRNLFFDSKKQLWIITDNNRVGRFDTKTFKFRETAIPPEVRKFYNPADLVELPGVGLMLIKSEGGIARYNEATNAFVPATSLFPVPANWKINLIHWDEKIKRYWLSCDSGLLQYDPVRKISNYRNHNPDGDPVIAAFGNETFTRDVVTDREGNVIFNYWKKGETSPSICRYNRRLGKAEKYNLVHQLGYHDVFNFLVQQNGRVWIYGLPFLAEWEKGGQPIKFIQKSTSINSINFDYLYQAVEDRENNIWLATDNGVFLFNPDAQIFNSFSLIRPDGVVKEAPVQGAAELKDGRIFLGSWGQGIYCFDQNFNPLPLPASFGKNSDKLAVWDMAVHPKDGTLWVTLQAGGILVYDPAKNTTRILYPEIFQGSTVRQVDEDTSGNMWFGTHNGRVIKWDYKLSGNDPSKGYEFVCQVGMVHKIHYDYSGYIWVGSFGHGLAKIDAHTKKIVRIFTSDGPPGERLFTDSPFDMTYYNDSTLVVAAGCLNIINTKTNKIRYISSEDGLPSNTVESVERDEKGTIWAGMTNGICRVNLEKKLISYFDRRDGIAYDKFSAAGVSELEDGRILLFTDHDFLVFDPAHFGQQSRPPRPTITSVRLGGKTLSVDSLIHHGNLFLSYDNTSIGIDFSSLSFLQQRKLHYYYKLDPVDKEWIRSDNPKEAIYNFLAPGDYRFLVRVENADGISNDYIASFPIVVRPPFWNTWWFYGLMALLVITVLYLIDRERINKRKSIQQMRRQIAGNLHTEVNNTLNNINVLSEIAKIKADKNVEQSKAFIDQISTKSKYMIEAMDDMLWSIDPKNDSMKKTLLRFKEFTENMRSAYGVDIDLIVDNKIHSLELDMKLRHEILSSYKEILGFLVAHNRCSQVFVNINLVKSRLLLEILTECENASEDFKNRFNKILKKREQSLPASVEVISDSHSFCVLLYIQLR